MAPNPGKTGNAIAQASLNETKRQYNEQKEKEEAKKARDKANATASRAGNIFSYSNNASTSNNLTQGNNPNYSLLSMGGTAPAFTELMGGAGMHDKLGG